MDPSRRRPLAAAVTVVTAIILLLTVATRAAAHRYTYSIETRGDVQGDPEWLRSIARTALTNERGGTLGGHNRFVEVRGR